MSQEVPLETFYPPKKPRPTLISEHWSRAHTHESHPDGRWHGRGLNPANVQSHGQSCFIKKILNPVQIQENLFSQFIATVPRVLPVLIWGNMFYRKQIGSWFRNLVKMASSTLLWLGEAFDQKNGDICRLSHFVQVSICAGNKDHFPDLYLYLCWKQWLYSEQGLYFTSTCWNLAASSLRPGQLMQIDSRLRNKTPNANKLRLAINNLAIRHGRLENAV